MVQIQPGRPLQTMKHDFEKGWLVGGLTGFAVGIMATMLAMTAACTAPNSKLVMTPIQTAIKSEPIRFHDTVLSKGCYIAASGYKDAYEASMQLKNRAHWSSLMYVNVTKTEGHAICVFIYDGRIKAYDNLIGTVDVGDWGLNLPTPQQIAARIDPCYSNAQWYK